MAFMGDWVQVCPFMSWPSLSFLSIYPSFSLYLLSCLFLIAWRLLRAVMKLARLSLPCRPRHCSIIFPRQAPCHLSQKGRRKRGNREPEESRTFSKWDAHFLMQSSGEAVGDLMVVAVNIHMQKCIVSGNSRTSALLIVSKYSMRTGQLLLCLLAWV